VLQLKSPYRDGTTHIVMSPLELMQRLAALVPRPRLHLIRFHGVLAPHAKLRAAIVAPLAQQATEHAGDHAHAPGSPARMSWARLLQGNSHTLPTSRTIRLALRLCDRVMPSRINL
jgi:hypothetical protein